MNIIRILNLACWAALGIFTAKIEMKTSHWFILLIIVSLIQMTAAVYISTQYMLIGGTVCL